VNCLPLPIEELTRRVVAGEPFALVRYGDGEFVCLAGQHGKNFHWQWPTRTASRRGR